MGTDILRHGGLCSGLGRQKMVKNRPWNSLELDKVNELSNDTRRKEDYTLTPSKTAITIPSSRMYVSPTYMSSLSSSGCILLYVW